MPAVYAAYVHAQVEIYSCLLYTFPSPKPVATGTSAVDMVVRQYFFKHIAVYRKEGGQLVGRYAEAWNVAYLK